MVPALHRLDMTGDEDMLSECEKEIEGAFYSENYIHDEWDYSDGKVQVVANDEIPIGWIEAFCKDNLKEDEYGISCLCDGSFCKCYMPLRAAVELLADTYHQRLSDGDISAYDIIREHRVYVMDPTMDDRFLSEAAQKQLDRIYDAGLEKMQWTNEAIEELVDIKCETEDEEYLTLLYLNKHDPMVQSRSKDYISGDVQCFFESKIEAALEDDPDADVDAIRYELEHLSVECEERVEGLSYAG